MLEKHVDAASCSIIPFSNKLFWIDQLGQIRYDATRELVQSKIDHNQEAWAWIFSYNGWVCLETVTSSYKCCFTNYQASKVV